jgi:hypothetical protein
MMKFLAPNSYGNVFHEFVGEKVDKRTASGSLQVGH